MNIPSQIVAGDSLTWEDVPTTDNLGNSLDSATWTLVYYFRGATSLSVTAIASGSGWSTSITSIQSAGLSVGIYYWSASVASGSSKITIGTGQIKVLKNLSAVSGVYDGRTQNQQDLDAVQQAMRAMIAGGAVAEYSIGGRSLKKITLADLVMMEANLKTAVAREKRAESIANGLGNPGNVFVRFGK